MKVQPLISPFAQEINREFEKKQQKSLNGVSDFYFIQNSHQMNNL